MVSLPALPGNYSDLWDLCYPANKPGGVFAQVDQCHCVSEVANHCQASKDCICPWSIKEDMNELNIVSKIFNRNAYESEQRIHILAVCQDLKIQVLPATFFVVVYI